MRVFADGETMTPQELWTLFVLKGGHVLRGCEYRREADVVWRCPACLFMWAEEL